MSQYTTFQDGRNLQDSVTSTSEKIVTESCKQDYQMRETQSQINGELQIQHKCQDGFLLPIVHEEIIAFSEDVQGHHMRPSVPDHEYYSIGNTEDTEYRQHDMCTQTDISMEDMSRLLNLEKKFEDPKALYRESFIQKSAIKAKLIELNAYVDDELPDYIMVMVANKKPRSQMNDDLGLFLNTNTEKFTIWLYNLLEKLQSLGSDQLKSNEIDSSQSKESPDEESHDKQNVSTVAPKVKEKSVKEKPPTKTKSSTTKVKASSSKGKSETKTKTDTKTKSESTKVDKVKTIVKEKVEKTATKTEKSVEAKPIKAQKRPAAVLQDEDVLTDLLGDRAETDEFSAEFKEEPEVKKVKKTVVAEKIKPTVTSTTSAARQAISTSELRNRTTRSSLDSPKPGSVHSRLGVARSSLGEERGRKNLPRAVTSPIKRAGSPGRRRLQSGDSYSSREVHPVRRRQPMSYVGKVRSREFEEEDEEEEDNPRAGGMSSVIAFSSRRPSVPLAQQANKNLILRATKEAERSVTSTMKSVLSEKKLYSEKMYNEKEKAYVKPIQQSEDKKVTVTLHGKRSGRVIGRVAAQLNPDSQRGLVSRSKREALDQTDYDRRRVGLESKSKREELIRGMTYTIENRQLEKPKPLQQSKTTGQEVARVRPVVDNRFILKVKQEEEESEGGSRDSSVVEEEETEAVVYEEEASPVASEEPEATPSSGDEIDPEIHQILQAEDAAALGEEEIIPSPATDSKEGEEEEEEVEEEDKVSEEIQDNELTIAKEDEVHDDDDEDEQRRKLLRQQKMMRQKARAEKRRAQLDLKKNPKKAKPTAEVPPSDTRFIVTLDGVDPDVYPTGVDPEVLDTTGEEVQYDEEEVEEFQFEEEAEEPVEKPVEDPLLKLKPPEIQPISISLTDTDDEEEEGEPLPSTIAKSTERCRFWPACINGNACPYAHPTQPCKMFPHCKFADKCLYIHPNCKFDSKCTRKDCPFTHASKRSNLTTVIQKIVQVPVPTPIGVGGGGSYPPGKSSGICRFFPNCTNMNCTFIHPMPCKFGISCMNKSKCKFYHAPLPTKDKLTWTATGKQGVK